MGLFQKAVETYDSMVNLAGVKVEGKETLAPVGHIITNAAIEVTIDDKGNFVSACRLDEKIPIPCTEKSSGRTSAAIAHPLCDNIGYVSTMNEEKHSLYLEALEGWAKSEYGNDKLDAVYRYVCKGTLLEDLKNADLVTIDDKGKVKNEKDIVTWRVIGLNKDSGAVYEDRNLQKSYYEYYLNSGDYEQGFCMISGDNSKLASQHIKGISSKSGNAKVISSNDNTNYTYRGRFLNDVEAMSISYESSQKALNALKWIISNEGVALGEREMACWNPKGIKVPKIDVPLIFDNSEKLEVGTYSENLDKVIKGYAANLPADESVVIAAFEAATSGRLSVTYYNELQGSDFLERLRYWDETCCWCSYQWGVSSPSLYQIVNSAYGVYRGDTTKGKFESDRRVVGQQMQRLIACRVDKAKFPIDIMRSITEKASRLQLYSSGVREMILFTACASIRKCRKDNFKEEWSMALEPEKRDRSYQYGRLLAVLEKIEKDTYGSDERRETNAIRLQSFYVQRPQEGFSQIMTQLKTAYYPRLSVGSRNYYDKLIGQIVEMISDVSEHNIGDPLKETYLMGYYLQKNDLYSKKENKVDAEREEK